jgi:hypothetical protein
MNNPAKNFGMVVPPCGLRLSFGGYVEQLKFALDSLCRRA